MAGMAAGNHGWLDYSILLLLAAFAVALPLLLQFGARLLRPKELQREIPKEIDAFQVERDVSRKQSIHTRYFSAVQVGSAWVLPLGLLIPIAHPEVKDSIYATVSLLSICLTMGVALIYLNRKGDLKWMESSRNPADHRDTDSEEEGAV